MNLPLNENVWLESAKVMFPSGQWHVFHAPLKHERENKLVRSCALWNFVKYTVVLINDEFCDNIRILLL